jgi:hypothetical protein
MVGYRIFEWPNTSISILKITFISQWSNSHGYYEISVLIFSTTNRGVSCWETAPLTVTFILSRWYDRVLMGKKVELSLCFTWAPRHGGVLGEWRCSSTHSLTMALDGGEWSASRPARFTPRERAPGTHWIGVWVGPSAVLDAVVKRRLEPPIIQPIFQRCTTEISHYRILIETVS